MDLVNVLKKSLLSIAVPLVISSCASTKSADSVLDYNSSHTRVDSFSRYYQPNTSYLDFNLNLDYYPYTEYNYLALNRVSIGLFPNMGRYSRNRDSDGDGIVNYYDLAPYQYGPHLDTNGNGYPDAYDTYIGTPLDYNMFVTPHRYTWLSPYRYSLYAHNSFRLNQPRYKKYTDKTRTRRTTPYRQNRGVRLPQTRSSTNTTRAHQPRSANTRNYDRGRSSSPVYSPRRTTRTPSSTRYKTPTRSPSKNNASTQYRAQQRAPSSTRSTSTYQRNKTTSPRTSTSRSSSKVTQPKNTYRSSTKRTNTYRVPTRTPRKSATRSSSRSSNNSPRRNQ